MSYQVLARKYRPKNFETLVGQDHVVRALTHALDSKRLHHAYLFTGTRGVGKTTLSRILAKSLNCETGITAHPCGVCDACVAIDAGRFVDYIEMDAASNRGVDEMAQLLEQAVYAPSNARFKVYMIDEVHMLTNHAFNSMLKTLEEPPEHVKFILATTDPQKIPVTVLSRCLQFNLKQMPPGHIIGHLENILGQEGVEYDSPALRLLAQGAHGSMRDALSLTDQAIAYAAGKVTLEAVQGMLGALDQSYLVRLLDCLAEQNAAGLLAVADEMAARSLSYNNALQDLGTLLHRVAVAQTVPAAVPDDVPEREDVLRLATLFGAEDVQLFYQIAVHGRNELALAPDEYAGFTMTLLRMLAFRLDEPEAASQAPAAPAAAALARGPARPSAAAAVQASAAVASAMPARPAAPAAAPAPVRNTGMSPARAALEAARAASRPAGQAAPRPAPKLVSVATNAAAVEAAPPWEAEIPAWDPAPVPAAEAAPEPQAEPESQPAPASADVISLNVAPSPPAELKLFPVSALNWDGDWPALALELPMRGVAQQLAMQTELVSCDYGETGLALGLRVPLETFCTAANVEKLTTCLSERFNCKVQVATEIAPARHTGSALAEARRAERQRQAEQTVESDPFVKSLMRELGATIVPGSIRPAQGDAG